MTTDFDLTPEGQRTNRLARNARLYQHDPQLERVLEMMRNDPEAWKRLPRDLVSQAGVYVDLKRHYTDAVNAGAIDDSGPDAA